MQELDANDSRAEKVKQRKKQKKLKVKMQKIAERKGCTVSELEMQNKSLEEERQQEEKAKEKSQRKEERRQTDTRGLFE